MNNLEESNQGQVQQVSFAPVQHNLANIMPTSSEIASLWVSYFAESQSICFLKSFVANSKDPDIHSVLQLALDVSSQRVKNMKDIYSSINHPIPEAFSDKDVDVNARQLFAESFTLSYTRLMHRFVLIDYANALTISSRPDFRNYFFECIDKSQEIVQKATDILLAKGLSIKHPHIVIPDRVDFVHDKKYFGTNIGMLIGDKRPLNALEISHIFSTMETKKLLRILNIGLKQVAKSEKVKDYLDEALRIGDKQLKVLGSLLADVDIPHPSVADILITGSKESPISDKLILSHVSVVTAFIIVEYGFALIHSARIDLGAIFGDFITELLRFAKNGADLMIEAGWLERIPETINHEKESMQH
ncbi:DUF3231 family protein [Desulfosporosinus lacus]|uniref:Predicted acetyltransferase n=1 Tax=Desulfosporosinus lacus DSM 15449 TaxID=1121420 RepID=A0A1M5QLA8_9FIRM|nr:DUF3231 family protein [Desulfosporosinus lacus]SHH14393.1 Predicted acetyltransferase [Desulfosporosinus lacus DSM 15449]